MDATTPLAFDFEETPVRVVLIDDAPWWAGKDVCTALEIENHRDSLSRLADDERRGSLIPTPSGTQRMICVNEPGLYRLIFTSRKEAAERFKRWLAHEVLPALRRTGRFALDDAPDREDGEDLARWELGLATVREARRLWGRPAARRLWHRLDLPDPGIATGALDALPDTPEDKVLAAVDATDTGAGLTMKELTRLTRSLTTATRHVAVNRLAEAGAIRQQRAENGWTRIYAAEERGLA